MISLLLLASMAGQQSRDVLADHALAKPVTFMLRATNAVAAVRELGAVANVHLVAEEVMRPEIVILRLTKVPLSEAMKRLATATAGSWIREGTTYRLGRSVAETRTLADAANAKDVDDLINVIADAKRRVASAKSFDSTAAAELAKRVEALHYDPYTKGSPGPSKGELLKIQGQAPIERLFDSVLSQVDPHILNSARPGYRTVASTSPNEMEIPLGVDASAAVAAFIAEQAIWVAKVNPKHLSSNELPIMRLPNSIELAVTKPVAKLDVVLDRTGGLVVKLELVDADGEIVASTARQVDSVPSLDSLRRQAPKPNEKRLSISSDERSEIQELAHSMGMPITPAPLSAAGTARIEQPEKFDPLSTFVSTFFLESADELGVNVVADVPDIYYIFGAAAASEGQPTAQTWLAMVNELGSAFAPTRIDGKWIEIDGGRLGPLNPISSRANRKLLSDLYEDAHLHGATTEAFARYAFASEQPTPEIVSISRLSMLAGGFEPDQWNILRILGALESDETATEITSQKRVLADLDPATLKVFTEVVCYQDPRLSGSGDLSVEPCDALPEGLPRNGKLVLFSSQDQVAFIWEEGSYEGYTADRIAQNTYEKSHPEKYQSFDPPTTSDKVWMGTKRKVDLGLSLGLCYQHFDYEEDHHASGEPQPFTSLPAGFVAEVNKQLAILRERDKPASGH